MYSSVNERCAEDGRVVAEQLLVLLTCSLVGTHNEIVGEKKGGGGGRGRGGGGGGGGGGRGEGSTPW